MATNPNTRKRRVRTNPRTSNPGAGNPPLSKHQQRRRRLQLWLVLGLALAMVLPLAAGILFTLLG